MRSSIWTSLSWCTCFAIRLVEQVKQSISARWPRKTSDKSRVFIPLTIAARYVANKDVFQEVRKQSKQTTHFERIRLFDAVAWLRLQVTSFNVHINTKLHSQFDGTVDSHILIVIFVFLGRWNRNVTFASPFDRLLDVGTCVHPRHLSTFPTQNSIARRRCHIWQCRPLSPPTDRLADVCPVCHPGTSYGRRSAVNFATCSVLMITSCVGRGSPSLHTSAAAAAADVAADASPTSSAAEMAASTSTVTVRHCSGILSPFTKPLKPSCARMV